ncbi:MAG TPA: hypothetical protein VMV02_07340 [Acidimicrobiales bacterium]|nr:hypothetical protein [Acidimicrobiales bacterium]
MVGDERGRGEGVDRAWPVEALEAVVHDLNNLFGVIMNYAAVVRAEIREASAVGGEEQRRTVLADLDQIVRATERAGVLTRGLLEPAPEP